ISLARRDWHPNSGLILAYPTLPSRAQLADIVQQHGQFGRTADIACRPAEAPLQPLRQPYHLIPCPAGTERRLVDVCDVLCIGLQLVGVAGACLLRLRRRDERLPSVWIARLTQYQSAPSIIARYRWMDDQQRCP